jgi:hypothetical protein
MTQFRFVPLAWLAMALALTCGWGTVRAAEAPTPDPNAALLTAMNELDRLYLPLIGTVGEGEAPAAKAWAAKLIEFWPTFLNRCSNAYPADVRMRDVLGEVRAKVGSAEKLIGEGNLPDAESDLQAGRGLLMQLRVRIGLEYYPDALSRYFEVLNPTASLAAKLNPTNALNSELLKLRDYCIAAKMAWGQLAQTKFDPASIQFSPAQAAAFTKEFAASEAAMAKVIAAFEEGKPPAMLDSVKGLKAAHCGLLKTFAAAPPTADAGK